MAEQDQSEEGAPAAVPASGQQKDTMAEVPGGLADQIAAAVTGMPGVVSLDSGALGDVATELPTRQVQGVRSTAGLMLSEPVDVIVADIATTADEALGL